MCILRLGENGLKKYRLATEWEQFKIVLLFMDHPVIESWLQYSSLSHGWMLLDQVAGTTNCLVVGNPCTYHTIKGNGIKDIGENVVNEGCCKRWRYRYPGRHSDSRKKPIGMHTISKKVLDHGSHCI